MRVFTTVKIVRGTVMFVAFATTSAFAREAPTVAPCALPNVRAFILRAAVPDEPPIAVQQGITGTVNVVVWLDAQSAVLRAAVQSSPSALLNASALRAARESIYRTAIAGCFAVPSVILFSARFVNPYGSAPAHDSNAADRAGTWPPARHLQRKTDAEAGLPDTLPSNSVYFGS